MSNGRIPDEIIDAVLKAHDICDVVGRYVHLTRQGQYMKGLCPFHSEKTPSFTVTPEKQIYHCFGCGAGGNLIRFVQEVEAVSFAEAVRSLASEANISLGAHVIEDAAETKEQQDRRKLLEAYEWAGKLYQYILMNTEQGKPARQYLYDRGITDRMIETFGIGYAYSHWSKLAELLEKRGFPMPLMVQGGLVSAREGGGYYDKFRDRIMFPIHNAQGQLIAFAGRAMGDVQPKYMNSPESALFHKSRTLYNLHRSRAHIRKSRELVLLEGYMDVIKASEAGIAGGVATMGTALTAEHASLIRKLAERVVIAYDGDSAGQAAAHKSIPILENAGLQVKVALLPSNMDPDEYIEAYGAERFRREVVEAAVPAIKFKLLSYRKNYRLQEDGEKLRYIHHALKLIASLPSPIEREHYVKELASEFPMVSYESQMQTLNQFRLEAEKKSRSGDNIHDPWNNVMNDGKTRERAPSLFPAFHNAERQLLGAMMTDRELAHYVEQQIGDQFNVEAHAALAAHIYGYYAQGFEPETVTFIGMLQDAELESLASSLLMSYSSQGLNSRAVDDCIREIKKVPLLRSIEKKREEMISAEKSGDILKAARIGIEIISLEKQLKTS